MVQTTFNVGNAGSLTTVLQEISAGGTDAAINTAYTIQMTAGVSLTAAVNLDAGSSLLLEGSFPFIVPAFTATGTVITDLNFTGTVTLDNGVLDNPALLIVSGTTVAGLFSGTVLGTSGDTGDTAINNGIIQSGGNFAAIEFYNGVVQNGWGGSPSALISGVPAGVDLLTSGLVQNGGTIIGTGPTSAAVFLGAGTVDNGQIGDALALLSGSQNGVVIQGAGVINNDGSIFATAADAVYIGSGQVTNGQIGSGSAVINGGTSGNGVSINFGLGTVANFGSIIGGGAAGVYLGFGGTVTNGAASDPTALISGAAEGVLLLAAGSLQNSGIVLGDGSDAAQSVIGAFFDAGGTIENLTSTALIGGLEWGAVVENGAGFVSNLGTIQATAASGFGADLTAGGTVVNAAGATISGPYDGVRVSAGAAGAGAVVMNDGTIAGSVAVDFQSGATEAAGTLTNDGLIESTGGGDAVVFGTGTERLILQSAGVFVGNVVGGETSGSSTTLELASGTQGTLSGLAGNGGTVTDGAGSFVFSAMATIAVDAGALWTIAAPGTLNTLNNAGVLDISAGAVTVTGSLTNSGSLAIGGSTLIATTGQVADLGIITVGSGGLLKASGGGISAAGTADIQVGGGASATLNVTGAGATVNTNGYRLGIGTSGDGSVLVGQGGTVLAGTPYAADEAITIGGSAGATGGLTVTDPGSLVRSTGQLSVGYGGTGSLLVENQATVVTGNNTVDKSEGFDIGQLATGSGEVTVTGTHSALFNTGRFIVGDAGEGSLSIQSGGTVTTTPGTVAGLAAATIAASASASGSSVTVTGPGSTFQIIGSLQVGAAGAGLLTLTNGATATATTLDAGLLAGGVGNITVTGPATALTTTGSLSIGDAGAGELSILNGANVTIGGDFDIGLGTGGSGNVDIEDTTGTVYVGGNLNIGQNGGPAVLTVGPDSTLEVDNGFINGGPGGVLNLYTSIDPLVVKNLTINVAASDTTPENVTAYTLNDTFNLAEGADYILNTPSLVGTNSFTLGTVSDTDDTTLILNADTVSATTAIAFTNALGTLVIGTDQLATINSPTSGKNETNPNDGDAVIGGFHGVIRNFTAGDAIMVNTAGPATFSQSGSVISVIENGTTVGVLAFDTAANAQAAFTAPDALVDNALCFLAGTLIGTPEGQIEVERLAAGDHVLTASGAVRPVVWVGHGRVLATRGRRGPATPVIVRKGALAPNVPHQDLRVTKGHAFWFDGVLIPVEFLVNHRSILWDDRAQEVSVYHVELDAHDVLLANGAAAESYRDDGNRWLFQNANAGWDLPAKGPCAEVLTGGPMVDAVWRRLLEVCGPRPSVPLTADADVHLLVDGVRVEATTRTGDIHVFAVNASDGVRLASRSAVPQELGLARDPRCLGVAVRRMSIRQGTHFRTVRGDDARLADGFHPFEPGTGLRWTDGDATLPPTLFAGFSGPCELVIHLGGTASYIDDGAAERMA